MRKKGRGREEEEEEKKQEEQLCKAMWSLQWLGNVAGVKGFQGLPT